MICNLGLAAAALWGWQVARPLVSLPHRATAGARRAEVEATIALQLTFYLPMIYVICTEHGDVVSLLEPGTLYAEPSTNAS